MSMFRLLCSLLCALAYSTTAVADDQHCLKVGRVEFLANNVQASKGFSEIFERAGLCADFIVLPVRRSEQMLLNGELDGEMMRTQHWAQSNSDTVTLVPTPIYVDQMVAISLRANQFQLTSLVDLKKLRIVISGGHRWAEAKMAEIDVEPMRAGNGQRFMELLRSGKADAGFLEQSLLPLVQKLEDFQVDPIVPLPYHIVLHRRHEAIVPILEEALKAYLSRAS